MPNWVFNTVTITDGDHKEVFDFMKTDDNDFDYNQVTEDWGVKWNAREIYFNDENEVTFKSPWGHPQPVLDALSEKFPDHEFFVFWEEEQGYGGEYEIKNGEIFNEKEFDAPEYREYVGSDGFEIGIRIYPLEHPEYVDGENFVRDDTYEGFSSFEAATVGYERREKLKNYNN